MKSLVIVLCALNCAYASEENAAEILENAFHLTAEGSYNYALKTSNGISAEANAVLKPANNKADVAWLEVQGSNQYQSPNGDIIQLSYIANENGYQPQGAHLPTPPPTQPVPDYIIRSLEYINAHPYEEKKITKN